MKIDGKTKVFGLYGDPVEHSLSPSMQNAAFNTAELNCCYLPFKVTRENLPAAVQAVLSLNISGVNITSPHKEKVISLLHNLSEEAVLLGAVNTIKNENSRLRGFNTDVEGFSFLLKNNIQRQYEKEYVILLGAGGAAKAVALSLSHIPLKTLVIANRTIQKAEKLAELLIKHNKFTKEKILIVPLEKDMLTPQIESSTLIVNALSDDPFELGHLTNSKLSPGCHAIDLRYNPAETPFMLWARENGAAVINGLDMLLGQGVQAFEIFTGRKAPVSAMEKVLSGNLNK